LVTHELARVFRTESHPLLIRAGNTVQVGAGREQRQQQAAAAFTCPHALNPNATYLLYDDITTTGSTLTAAAQVLQAAGARRVIVAVLAKSR
jgi:predicted amidophosphoribosyltransferase